MFIQGAIALYLKNDLSLMEKGWVPALLESCREGTPPHVEGSVRAGETATSLGGDGRDGVGQPADEAGPGRVYCSAGVLDLPGTAVTWTTVPTLGLGLRYSGWTWMRRPCPHTQAAGTLALVLSPSPLPSSSV